MESENQPVDESLSGPQSRDAALPPTRRGRQLRVRFALLAAGTLAIATLAVPAAAGSAQLVWNMSASAPVGLYRIERVGWHVGDRVAVIPAIELAADLDVRDVLPSGKLLIKRVVAAGGDAVCRQDDAVSVNGEDVARAKAIDSKARSLPSWQGCVTLDDGQVFLLGDTSGSYDGRYFGVTRAREIVGRADLLLAF